MQPNHKSLDPELIFPLLLNIQVAYADLEENSYADYWDKAPDLVKLPRALSDLTPKSNKPRWTGTGEGTFSYSASLMRQYFLQEDKSVANRGTASCPGKGSFAFNIWMYSVQC